MCKSSGGGALSLLRRGRLATGRRGDGLYDFSITGSGGDIIKLSFTPVCPEPKFAIMEDELQARCEWKNVQLRPKSFDPSNIA
jgi:hypothetical protein